MFVDLMFMGVVMTKQSFSKYMWSDCGPDNTLSTRNNRDKTNEFIGDTVSHKIMNMCKVAFVKSKT